MYRLYVDEVGTDGLTNTERDKHRFLSLTGVAMQLDHARDQLEPNMNWIKAHVFEHDPDQPIILHRKEIMGGKGVFGVLNRDIEKKSLWDRSIIRLFQVTEYIVITALIDKNWMLRQRHWKKSHPYHYLMEILVEKYVRFLERKNAIGDIMPESRNKPDAFLQASFDEIKKNGTDFVDNRRICSRLRGNKLKFRKKNDNVAGLQFCDLIAHPSHMNVRHMMGHDVQLGPFARQIVDILNASKYDRSVTGKIVGYGVKHLPQ